jgi:hypothetical protein
MLPQKGRLALAAVVLCIGFGGGGRAEAGGIVLNTPAGLSPGATFRFVFVTDGANDGTSSSISTYNTFVNADATSEAGGGAVTYNGVALTWSAIASTASTDAINNVGVSGAPVYLASGTLVRSSDSSSGLWSGSLNNPINQDLKGNVFGDIGVWTGTLASGAGDPGFQLGNSSVEFGSTSSASSSWVSAFPFPTGLEDLALYGISQVLVAGSSVPEPSTLVLAGTAVIAGSAFGRSRGHRNRRRL